jgi:molybdopterin/thiamine biosynthesis adenylyltransferase
MTNHRITILGRMEKELREWLSGDANGHERGAIVLFRRLSRRKIRNFDISDRFLAVEVIKMSGDWVIESSKTHLRINMRKLPEVYYRCEKEGLELGFVHNHPTGLSEFSEKDRVNELNIMRGLAGCNGKKSFLVSLLLSSDKWYARIRQGFNPEQVLSVRHIMVIGNKIELHGISNLADLESLRRQEAAFGKPFNAMLQSLRIVVVGVGGTGSPVATLLARSGVGELILIDGDNLEHTNMNRVRGYRSKDAGKNKASSLAKFIRSLGLKTAVCAINSYLDTPKALDSLSSADVIFGCTDDQSGRSLMNQAMYYYGQVYIDMGLTGAVRMDENEQPYLSDHRGRISCILPEHGACLKCQRVINLERLRYEQELKLRPELAKLDPATLKKEHYLVGGGEQAPGVGPFTSGTADHAVATFMNLVKPYRKIPTDLRQDNIWIDFIHLNIYSNEPINDGSCIYCAKHFLLLKDEGGYRLEMPGYGKYKNL